MSNLYPYATAVVPDTFIEHPVEFRTDDLLSLVTEGAIVLQQLFQLAVFVLGQLSLCIVHIVYC